MCTVTLLFPSNPIQANVKTFNLLFIILSRHHSLPRSHFSSQLQSILALKVCLCTTQTPPTSPTPLGSPLHPVLFCDIQQIPAPSHGLFKSLLKLFDFQLGCLKEWRPSGSSLTAWQSVASTVALPKGGEIRWLQRCVCASQMPECVL